MDREEAMERCDNALQELSKALQQGKSEALLRYLDFCGKFHRYSFRNQLLIAMQHPSASHVAGFQRWRELKRYVRKGEKGIAILAPMMVKAKHQGEAKPDSEKFNAPMAKDEKARTLRGFRVAHVFDIAQTDGEAPPELEQRVEGDPGVHLQRLEQIVRSKGIELTYEPSLDGALGLSKGGMIHVLAELDSATRFSVLIHELAHELLHRGDRRSQTTKTLRETEAEAVAYTVCRAVGLPASNRSADYIQLYSGDVELLSQSLELIRSVANGILSDLESETVESADSAKLGGFHSQLASK